MTERDTTTRSVPPVHLRAGIAIEDPVPVVLGFLEAWRIDVGDVSASFRESDLRLANRGGARISSNEIAAVLERRRAIERALRAAGSRASLAQASNSVPWLALQRLFDAFAGIRGIGFSKMTKTLHPKRPALVPMLDSVVQTYLADDDPGAGAPFGERAVALVRGYKRDLDRNRAAMQVVRKELARRGHDVTEVRILDLLIWSARGTSTPGVTVDDVRELARGLPRAYEVVVRGRVKFRVGSIVWLAFSADETELGFAFPKEWRQALVDGDPQKFVMPSPADLKYNWAVVRLSAIDRDELLDLVFEAWSMVVPRYVVDDYVREQEASS